LAGIVHLGDRVFVGAGVATAQCITVCSDVTIGVGAAVVKNIETKGTYIGVPAKPIK
jgi:UDP-N-acetylbacillosamine N-acetyltransferase